MEAREPHRIEHSARVGRLAAEMARGSGLSPAEVERVRVGGTLHDFGTVAIPHGILYKREFLSNAFGMTSSRPCRRVRDDRQPLRALEEEARRGQWDSALLPLLAAAAST